MAKPSAKTVLGKFDGSRIKLKTTIAQVFKEGDDFFMAIDDGMEPVKSKVELVVASGRQHQVYLGRTKDGQYQFLPLIWSVPKQRWILMSLYRPSALKLDHSRYWRRVDIGQEGGCFDCHLSQGHTKIGPRGPVPAWLELEVNCESCHGPGLEHVNLRRAGLDDEHYTDLHALSKEEDLKLCGQCHGAKWNLIDEGPRDNIAEHMFSTLAHRGFQPDGRQLLTTYQFAGHALSACYQKGAAGCSSCHDPHAQHARDLTGVVAEGADADLQCTVCHRDLIERKAAKQHSRHKALRCVDCHMSMSAIIDFKKTDQRTADHSISIPHPAETIELGTPNACVTCHIEHDSQWALSALSGWGAKRSTAVRPWVRTIAQAREKAQVTPSLLRLLDPSRGALLNASALRLLRKQPADPALFSKLEPLLQGTPQLRALALDALVHHAPKRSGHLLEKGRQDQSPFVRLRSFEATPKGWPLSAQDEGRYLQDLLNHARNPPLRRLDQLIERSLGRREGDRAAALIELRLRYTSAQGPGRARWERALYQARSL